MTRSAPDRALCLLDSATLSLAPDIVWDGARLQDAAAGTTFPINRVGRYVIESLGPDTSISTLANKLARRFEVEPATARADLRAFAFDLHAHQLVSIRQSYIREFLARVRNTWYAARDLALSGSLARFTYPNRRYPVGGWRVVLGSLEAHQPTVCYGIIGALAAGFAVALPGALRGQGPRITISLYAGLLVLTYVVVLIASSWLHELVHMWAAKHLGLRLKSVFVRMHVVGVTHEGGDPMKSAYVSAAGPAVTVLALVLLALGLSDAPLIPVSGRLEVAVLLLAVALQHLPGLTPLTADGRIAVAALGLLARSRMPDRSSR